MQASSISAYGPATAATKTSSAKSTASADTQTQTASGTAAGDNVEQQFLKWARMSPMDRMRANILKGMGLTEDDLKRMTPDQRAAIEQKIKDLIEQQFQKNAGKAGQVVDVSA